MQKQVDILISINQALQILHLKHHDNVYKTSYFIMDKKLTKSMKNLIPMKWINISYSTNCYWQHNKTETYPIANWSVFSQIRGVGTDAATARTKFPVVTSREPTILIS